MAKKSNDNGLIFGISALGLIVIGIILWLAYENDKKKKVITEKSNENDNLKNSLLDLDNQRNYWQNSYYSQSSWFQQFQQIPYPKDSIKRLIEQLEKLKVEVFKEKPDFAKELDDSIHALKGEKLQSSFGILAKIIENLLEQSFIEEPEFREQYKKKLEKGPEHLNMGNFIDFAIQKSYFEGEDVEFLKEIKKLRNDFVHEISPKIDENILIGLHIKIVETISFVVFETWSK
jgi:ATP-dependent Lon protease